MGSDVVRCLRGAFDGVRIDAILSHAARSPARIALITDIHGNAMMAELHDRMSVILELQSSPAWLGDVESDPAALLRPATEDVLKAWPISRRANSPRNNGAELLEAVS